MGSKPALNQFQTIQTGLDHLKLYFQTSFKLVPQQFFTGQIQEILVHFFKSGLKLDLNLFKTGLKPV